MPPTAGGEQCAKTTHTHPGPETTQVTHTQKTLFVPDSIHLNNMEHINENLFTGNKMKVILKPQREIKECPLHSLKALTEHLSANANCGQLNLSALPQYVC